MKQIEAPALVIAGDRDGIVPPQDSVRLAEALSARLVVVPQCGHLPREEQPQAFLEAVLPFIQRLS